jgi:hypothetical protein
MRKRRRGPPLGAGVPHWGLGSPTGGWGPPLGAGVPHGGHTEGGETEEITAEVAENAEGTEGEGEVLSPGALGVLAPMPLSHGERGVEGRRGWPARGEGAPRSPRRAPQG